MPNTQRTRTKTIDKNLITNEGYLNYLARNLEAELLQKSNETFYYKELSKKLKQKLMEAERIKLILIQHAWKNWEQRKVVPKSTVICETHKISQTKIQSTTTERVVSPRPPETDNENYDKVERTETLSEKLVPDRKQNKTNYGGFSEFFKNFQETEFGHQDESYYENPDNLVDILSKLINAWSKLKDSYGNLDGRDGRPPAADVYYNRYIDTIFDFVTYVEKVINKSDEINLGGRFSESYLKFLDSFGTKIAELVSVHDYQKFTKKLNDIKQAHLEKVKKRLYVPNFLKLMRDLFQQELEHAFHASTDPILAKICHDPFKACSEPPQDFIFPTLTVPCSSNAHLNEFISIWDCFIHNLIDHGQYLFVQEIKARLDQNTDLMSKYRELVDFIDGILSKLGHVVSSSITDVDKLQILERKLEQGYESDDQTRPRDQGTGPKCPNHLSYYLKYVADKLESLSDDIFQDWRICDQEILTRIRNIINGFVGLLREIPETVSDGDQNDHEFKLKWIALQNEIFLNFKDISDVFKIHKTTIDELQENKDRNLQDLHVGNKNFDDLRHRIDSLNAKNFIMNQGPKTEPHQTRTYLDVLEKCELILQASQELLEKSFLTLEAERDSLHKKISSDRDGDCNLNTFQNQILGDDKLGSDLTKYKQNNEDNTQLEFDPRLDHALKKLSESCNKESKRDKLTESSTSDRKTTNKR